MDLAHCDWDAMHDLLSVREESDMVTQEQRDEWHPGKLDPTQRLLHNYICIKWFHGVMGDYAIGRHQRKMQIKEFGTAGSGKTRLNRTIVVSLRGAPQSLRSLEESRLSTSAGNILSRRDLQVFLQSEIKQ